MKIKVLSVILPTFNEAGNIVSLVQSIHVVCKLNKIDHEILIIDDNSPDKTADIAQKKLVRNKQVHVYTRKKEKGLATAILYGIQKANGSHILVMDTDFNHDPTIIPTMAQQIEKYDLVIGSRFIKGGGMQNKVREFLSNIFNMYLMFLLGHRVHDNLSGFFIIRKKALQSCNLPILFTGFGEYFIRLINEMETKKRTIIEVPVFYKNRTYGVSKSQFLHMFITYTTCALQLRFKHV